MTNSTTLFVCLSGDTSPSLEAGSIKVKDTCPRLVVELRIPEGTTTHIYIIVVPFYEMLN